MREENRRHREVRARLPRWRQRDWLGLTAIITSAIFWALLLALFLR